MIEHTDIRYGTSSQDRLDQTGDPSPTGARAALESFYHALNHRDGEVMRAVWADDPLAQLNNPVGGILRGGEKAAALYDQIFAGPVRLEVSFGDIVEYLSADHALFAGRESGHYVAGASEPVALEIRTTRYFRYESGRWAQYHHHGSIDNPEALAAYQRAIAR
jgi:ketosteroid isomerase-like protein